LPKLDVRFSGYGNAAQFGEFSERKIAPSVSNCDNASASDPLHIADAADETNFTVDYT
jgi:hypothetical protein